MKFTTLSALLGVVGVSSVLAAPTDWIVLNSDKTDTEVAAIDRPIFRFGLAVPPPEFLGNARLVAEGLQAKPAVEPTPGAHRVHHPHMHKHHRHGCKGKWRVKMMKLSNKIRGALGLPLIDIKAMHHRHAHKHHHHHHHHDHKHGEEEVKDLHWAVIKAMKAHEVDSNSQETGFPEGIRRVHHIHAHQRLRDAPFVSRLTHSLMALGKWEGRAVAFVIGCGLGVLLRMAWVLTVLVIRAFKGPEEKQVQLEDVDVEYVVFDTDIKGEPAPPQYPIKLRTDEEIDAERKLIENLKAAGLI